MRKGRRILHWILTVAFVFLALSSFAMGSITGGIINLGMAVLSLPFDSITALWERITRGKHSLKYIYALIICVAAFSLTMASSAGTDGARKYAKTHVTADTSDTSTSSTSEDNDTQAASEEEDAQEAVEETASSEQSDAAAAQQAEEQKQSALSKIPAYSGTAYTAVNNNTPFFTDADLTTEAFESYSDLDSLGRCGVAYANVCMDIMPTESRGSIGSVRPTGWHTVKYAGIDGNYLYNRCHLIGYQLSAENANEKNLITGTRYLNIEGMLPFENMVADYVKETNHHVLYRVTPVFEGDNLLASGVLMEAESVEDNGEGILYCVYCYNVQPGITINYADGSSSGPEYTGSSSSNASASANASTGSTQSQTSDNNSSQSAANAGGYAAVQPDTSQAAAPSTTTGSETMVWVSATGSKYHSRNDCGNMNPNRATQMTESQAVAKGLGKCKKCW